jgi:hypothetical protein
MEAVHRSKSTTLHKMALFTIKYFLKYFPVMGMQVADTILYM